MKISQSIIGDIRSCNKNQTRDDGTREERETRRKKAAAGATGTDDAAVAALSATAAAATTTTKPTVCNGTQLYDANDGAAAEADRHDFGIV